MSTPVRPITRERLEAASTRWRRLQASAPEKVANAYRQCANDLDLILRDDATIQPGKSR